MQDTGDHCAELFWQGLARSEPGESDYGPVRVQKLDDIQARDVAQLHSADSAGVAL